MCLEELKVCQYKLGKQNVTWCLWHTNNYDVLLGLHFLFKIGIVVDIERGLIYVKQGLGSNVQVFPLNMVNMLKLVVEQPSHSKKTSNQITLAFFHLNWLTRWSK
jgi:hypothetical protein